MLENKEYGMKSADNSNKFDRFIIRDVLQYLKDIAITLSVIMVVFLFFFRMSVVDGSSMYDTLVHGDYVVLLSSAVAGEPEQGDIIVCSKETYSNGTPIIKRVIATEGQTVDIDFEIGAVYVDGVLLDEPYIYSKTDVFEGVSFPLTVDPGCLFVLGDNRGVSLDSRSPKIGLIDCREVVGKAIFILFPGKDPVTDKRDFTRIGAVS